MLRLLRIRNLAVIEAVEVEFEPGLNVLTGETGAGKSMLVEAVGLLLGARAAGDMVRTGETTATIEAIFEPVAADAADEIVIRREITAQGRSRAYVDGALATTATLRELAAGLVELQGQHEHQSLLDPLMHLPLLDAYAGGGALVDSVASAWERIHELRARLDRARMDTRERTARLDLIDFQLTELDRANPEPNEDEQLAATRQVLASADRIQRLCAESYAILYEQDAAVLSGLAAVWKRVADLAALEPQFASYLESRDGIKGQLEELAFSLRQYAEGVDTSPARLQDVEDRLALLERLKRKYGPALADVLQRRDALRRERDLLNGAAEATDVLERELAAASEEYLRAARELSRTRRRAARPFAEALETLFGELAMTQSRFEVRFNDGELPADSWGETGVDRAEFFLSPNPGEDLKPLSRIASGGELSRVMLALKTLSIRQARHPDGPASSLPQDAAPRRTLPFTLVFDEVDAGIGGRVADVVGSRLRQLGTEFQVLCITHLPQIAARAATHFRIDKTVVGSRTLTRVERLDEAARVQEIARMIGGSTVTEPVLATARDLLATGSSPPPRRTTTASRAARRTR